MAAFVSTERIGLIDEKASSHRLSYRVLDLRAAVTHVFTFQLEAVFLDEAILRQHPIRVQESRYQPRQRGLTRTWVACD